MQEYQISLEDKVRNAFIRRKADFLVRAMQSEEYKNAAKKARQELAGLIASACSQYGKDSYAVSDISEGLKAVEETLSGDVELQATKWAFELYSVPSQLRMFNEALKARFEEEGVNPEKLEPLFEKYIANIANNETLILHMMNLVKEKGDKSLEKINEIVKGAYPQKTGFIEKEKKFAEAYESYMFTALEMNEGISSPEGLYASMVTSALQKLVSIAYNKAAEIEADELYGKLI